MWDLHVSQKSCAYMKIELWDHVVKIQVWLIESFKWVLSIFFCKETTLICYCQCSKLHFKNWVGGQVLQCNYCDYNFFNFKQGDHKISLLWRLALQNNIHVYFHLFKPPWRQFIFLGIWSRGVLQHCLEIITHPCRFPQ